MGRRVDLDISIDRRGKVRCDVRQKGPSCLEIEQFVREILGPVESEAKKPDFFEVEVAPEAGLDIVRRRGAKDRSSTG